MAGRRAFALVLAAGCANLNGFPCQSSAACGAQGLCEPTGLCSFPDLACPSGRRYGEFAGELSGQCVPFPIDARASDGPTTSDARPGPDAAVDAAAGMCLQSGQRLCLDSAHSGHCGPIGNGMLAPVADRACPPSGSVCVGGYCQPPPGVSACTGDRDCGPSQSCVLYVGAGMPRGRCTPVAGGTSQYGSCTSNASWQCASGLCGSNVCPIMMCGQCVSPCLQDADCPGAGVGTRVHCALVRDPISLEGVLIADQRFCVVN